MKNTYVVHICCLTVDWKAVKQCFTVELFVSQFYPVCNFGKIFNLQLGTARSERVKINR